MSLHGKDYRDKVKELKAKIFVARQKFMLLHFFAAAKNDKLVATKFLCRDTEHSCRDKIQEEGTKLCRDRNCKPRQELGNKDDNYVAT